MKKITAFISLLIFAASCEKIQPTGSSIKQIKAIITDLKGAPVDEAASGFMLRLTAPEFIEFNKQGILVKDGFIAFDKGMVKIKDADGDHIFIDMPILDYTSPQQLQNMTLYIRQSPVLELCNECFIYDPTVQGTIFAGFRSGVTDRTFLKPAEMINDIAGNIYTIDQRDSNHDLILKTTAAGATTVFAGAGDLFGRLVGIGIDESRGLLYISDATSQQVKSIRIATPSVITVLAGSGVAGNTDGTGTAASFRFGNQRVDEPGSGEIGQGLAVDASGNVFVCEIYTSALSSQIRRISPIGVTNTVTGTRIIPTSAGSIVAASGIALNSVNEIFTCSGSPALFQGVSKFTPSGVYSSFAGQVSFVEFSDGIGAMARFIYPKAIRALNNYLFIADSHNGALRRISPSGFVHTLAGVGFQRTNSFHATADYLAPREGSYRIARTFFGTDVHQFENAATAIRMDRPGGVAVVNDGLIYVSDYGYKCIWKVTIR